MREPPNCYQRRTMPTQNFSFRIGFLAALMLVSPLVAGCGEGGSGSSTSTGVGGDGGAATALAPRCDATASGTATVQKPELLIKLADRYHEGWLASPAVADLNGDGTNEII